MGVTIRRLVFLVAAFLAATLLDDNCCEAFPHPSDALIHGLEFNRTSAEIREDATELGEGVVDLESLAGDEDKDIEGTTEITEIALVPHNRSARSCGCQPGCACSCTCHRQPSPPKCVTKRVHVECDESDGKFEKSLDMSVSAFKKSVTAGVDALGFVFKKLCSLPRKIKCEAPAPAPKVVCVKPKIHVQPYKEHHYIEKTYRSVLVPQYTKKTVRRPVPCTCAPKKTVPVPVPINCKDNFDEMKQFTIEFFTNFFGQIKLVLKSLDGMFAKVQKDVTPACVEYEVCEKRMESSKSIFDTVCGELFALLQYGPKFLNVLIDNESEKCKPIVVPDIPITCEPTKQIATSMKDLEGMMVGMMDLAKGWIGLYDDGKSKFDIGSLDKNFFAASEGAKFVNKDFMGQLMDLTSKLEGGRGEISIDKSMDKLESFDGLLEILKELPALVVEQLTGMTEAIGSFEGLASKAYGPIEAVNRGVPLKAFLDQTEEA